MAEHGTTIRDVAKLEVARVGRVEETGDGSMPFRLLDDRGVEIVVVTEFLHHMLADDASPASLRSGVAAVLRLRIAVMAPTCVLSRFLGIMPDAWRRAISRCGSRPARSRCGNAAPTHQHGDR